MTVLFKTLGCKVNRYDTETLRELFKKSGVESAKEGDIPDIIVINSCTVTAESDRKTRQTRKGQGSRQRRHRHRQCP